MATPPLPKYETITPNIAGVYLSKNTSKNYRHSTSRVSRYANDMKRGAWDLNGENIKFDINGELIDGQHRLRAIVESGMTVVIAVQRGVSVEAFKSIDTESKKAAVILEKMGFFDPTASAATAKLCLNLEAGSYANKPRARREVTDYAESNPGIQDAVAVTKNSAKMVPVGIMGAVLHLGTRNGENIDKLNSFVEAIRSGENLEAGDPRFALREYMIIQHGDKTRKRVQVGDVDVLKAVILGWNAFVSGKNIKSMRHALTYAAASPDIIGYNAAPKPTPTPKTKLKLAA